MSLVSMAIDSAKKDLKKIDKDHNGKPDVIEAVQKAEAALDRVDKALAKFPVARVLVIMTAVNKLIPDAEKIPDAELKEFSEALSHADDAVHMLEGILKEAENFIES